MEEQRFSANGFSARLYSCNTAVVGTGAAGYNCLLYTSRLAEAVARRLKLEQGELALAGSALVNDAFLRQCLSQELTRLEPGLTAVLPRQDAAMGAALLAREMLR